MIRFSYPTDWIAILVVVVFFLDTSLYAGEGPEMTRLFPAGGQRGTVVQVVASGKFPLWPLNAWCDCAGLEWKPLDAPGKFSVTVAGDAPLGVHWLRLYEANGATSAKPFLIGAIEESIEVEPNDRLAEGRLLETLPCVVNGVLEKTGDVDLVRVTLKAHETLIASIDSTRFLLSQVDACLQLVDSQGFVVAQNLDYHDLDPQIVYTAALDGEYSLRVFGFPSVPGGDISFAGDAGYIYRLTVTTGPWMEYCDPLAVSVTEATTLTLRGFGVASLSQVEVPPQAIAVDDGDRLFVMPGDLARGLVSLPILPYKVQRRDRQRHDQSMPLELPACVTGCLLEPHAKHAFRFDAKKDTAWRFSLDGRKLGSPIDAVLQLTDDQNKILVTADDSVDSVDPTIDWKCTEDGAYQVMIRDMYGTAGELHFYRLTINPQVPGVSLSLADDLITGKQGQEIEILVDIERTFGCAEEITVQCDSVQADIICEPVVSKAEGETAKQVKLKLLSNKLFQGPLQISTSMSRPPRRPIARAKSGKATIWLSVVQP